MIFAIVFYAVAAAAFLLTLFFLGFALVMEAVAEELNIMDRDGE